MDAIEDLNEAQRRLLEAWSAWRAAPPADRPRLMAAITEAQAVRDEALRLASGLRSSSRPRRP